MKVAGNVKGISQFWLEQLELLLEMSVERAQLADELLLAAMSRITGAIGKEIAVYLNRRGQVIFAEVGDKQTVSLTQLSQRRGEQRLCGVRLLHTHPGGDGHLSQMDLSALAIMRLDCVLAVGVTEDGQAANCGLAWGVLDETELPQALFYAHVQSVLEVDFAAAVAEIEKQVATNAPQDTADGITRAILVGITGTVREELAAYSMQELAQLADTAGVVVLDSMLQSKRSPDSGTFIGTGKVEELRFLAQIRRADSIIFDDELTPVQIRNLEQGTGRAIIDRSMLILDIFAARASSNEGKLQVELAQLKYMMPRLIGQGDLLSRLGGGIGTRGPGETKLEVDRRAIRKRIGELEERLHGVEKTRQLHRKQRTARTIPQVSLVGYTNAGKSTLLNALTDAGVLAENKLFATLDTTMRSLALGENREVLLSDTVGFIRKLPHHLIAAFRATLEEVVACDLLLHVMDCSSTEMEEQAAAVNSVLAGLGAADKPVLHVLNKIDLLEQDGALNRLLLKYDNCIAISARDKIGLEQLLVKIGEMLPRTESLLELLIPYQAGSLLALVHNECQVLREEYVAGGISLQVLAPTRQQKMLQEQGVIVEG